jgi:predicted ABC-type sugar transport system permease subunit
VLGLFNGALVAFAGLPPFIVTLGTYTALRGAAYLLADGTTVINSNISFEWIGNNYLGPVPWLVVIALAVVVVCWFILRRTTLGVHIYAVGGNMQAARLTGIKVWLVLLFVYGMSGLLSGLAGDERLAAVQRQRQLRHGLRTGRHRGGDPRRHQLCRRDRHHHRHAGGGVDHRHAQ